MFSTFHCALLLSTVASFYVASSGHPQINLPRSQPQINLPPCTDTLCISPCGFKLIEVFSLNVTGFPIDKDADYVKVTLGVKTEKKITSLKILASNLQAETIMGIHRLDSYTLDLCEELKKLKQGNPEDEYPVCPIPAEHYLTFSKSKELGFMKSFAKGVSGTIAVSDQDGVTIACAELKIAVN
jgi:hypothetical protein